MLLVVTQNVRPVWMFGRWKVFLNHPSDKVSHFVGTDHRGHFWKSLQKSSWPLSSWHRNCNLLDQQKKSARSGSQGSQCDPSNAGSTSRTDRHAILRLSTNIGDTPWRLAARSKTLLSKRPAFFDMRMACNSSVSCLFWESLQWIAGQSVAS